MFGVGSTREVVLDAGLTVLRRRPIWQQVHAVADTPPCIYEEGIKFPRTCWLRREVLNQNAGAE